MGQRAVAVPDPEWGALRTPRPAVSWNEGTAVVLTASAEVLAATRKELEQGGVDVRAAIDPLVAIALAVRHEHPEHTPVREAVIDLGQRDVRLGWVRWREVEGRAFPTLEAREVASPLAGARLDEDLAYSLEQPAEVARELKELLTRTRGPWARPHGEQACELEVHLGRTLLGEFAETWRVALPTLTAMLREREVERIVVAGGMARLAGVIEPLLESLASLKIPLLVAQAPSFAAARGAALAGSGAGSPGSPAVHVWENRGGQIVRRELIPAAQPLPAEFGPFTLRGSAGAPLLVELGAALHALDPPGDGVLTVEWTFDHGWRAFVDGAPCALREPTDAEREACATAATFDWSSCGQAVDVDALVVFRATAGGGRYHALVKSGLSALLAPLGSARCRGLAVGDHPQAHLRPRFVTSAQPGWGDADALEAFMAQVLSDPVEGIDVPDAFEVALEEACALDWRPGATRVVLVLTDVPCHLPENPPYTQVRWQDAAATLRGAGAELIGLHVQGGGRPPSVLRSAREFLAELDSSHHAFSGEVPDELSARLVALASRRKPDPAGQALIDALGGWSIG